MQISTSDAYHAVIRWQARREHSAQELREKLARYGASPEIITEVLAKVRDKDLQSDARFADCLTRSRMSQGYGMVRIRHLLMQKGIDEVLIEEALATYAEDGGELAFKVLAKKFNCQSRVPCHPREGGEPSMAWNCASAEMGPRLRGDDKGRGDDKRQGDDSGGSNDAWVKLQKMKRFLQYRGFSNDDIHAAVLLYQQRVLNVSHENDSN